MKNPDIAGFSAQLQTAAELLSFAVPVAVGLAGFFGLAVLVWFSFVRSH